MGVSAGLIPEYTREFFKKTFETVNGTIHQRKDTFYKIERIPSQIRRISQNTHPALTERNYPKVTFDKAQALKDQEAEFISFGHPLFEATIQYAEQTYTDALKTGACFEDPDGIFNGTVIFYEGEIRDGTDAVAGKRLFAYYLPENSETIEKVNPKLLWDFQEAQAEPATEGLKTQELEAKVVTQVRDHLEKYKQELTEERQRQVEIKRKYGITSLEQLVHKLDRELIELSIRHERGEDVRLVIQNKEEQKRHYESEKEALEKTCHQEVTLSRKLPILVGTIRVRPIVENDDSAPSQADKLKIERIGMACATHHEEAQGHIVTDVSAENLGFDLRSKTQAGKIRCIEVKARAERAPVLLTANEWHMAKQLKNDYFLYVVLNAATQPELYIIQNPAEQITAVQQITEVRYQVPLSQITGSREPV